jgi:hypothetical protein
VLENKHGQTRSDIDKLRTFFEGCHVEDVADGMFQKLKTSIAANCKAKKIRTSARVAPTNPKEVNLVLQEIIATIAVTAIVIAIIVMIAIIVTIETIIITMMIVETVITRTIVMKRSIVSTLIVAATVTIILM